ncbi:hypothetical protein ACQPZG_27205 [Streptomyces sp. CA-294286]|uniref:hypothetical protein n=1 Tax=Streptomyces sp. CA-294286 TaxID=3240070 RepID=UPI003D8F04B8
MKRSGPLHTLLAGLLLAAFMLSLNATTGTKESGYASGGAPSSTPGTPGTPGPPAPPVSSTSSPPTQAPSSSAAPPPVPTSAPARPATSAPASETVYAGRTTDGSAAVSVSVRDGEAVAYYCDGRTRESWLKGAVKEDGSMRLTGRNGAGLEASARAGTLTGTVAVTGREQNFTLVRATKPAGLYRATSQVRGAEVDAGWIVLPDGRQVGILTRDGRPAAAPELDPDTGTALVDDTRLVARPVSP